MPAKNGDLDPERIPEPRGSVRGGGQHEVPAGGVDRAADPPIVPFEHGDLVAAGWRFWYLDGDPALKGLQENREFRSIVNDRNRLVEQERAKLENG